MPIDEGPAANVGAVEYRGSTLERATLDSLSGIAAGTTYDPVAASQALLSIREQYLRKGFPAVRVVTSLEPMGTDLRLVFNITEGPRILIGNVEIVGLKRTRRSLVEKEIDLPAGEPLDPRKLAAVERRLTELGIFRRVIVSAGTESPATIRVELEEDAPYFAAYDLRYNEEESASALLDGEVRNVLGLGIALGGRFRYGRTIRDVRGSFSAPSFFWGGGDLTASVYTIRELVTIALEQPLQVGAFTKLGLTPGDFSKPTAEGNRSEKGFLVQQAMHIVHPWELLYGYRYKRTTCPAQGLPPISRNRQRRLFDPCETPLFRVDSSPGDGHPLGRRGRPRRVGAARHAGQPPEPRARIVPELERARGAAGAGVGLRLPEGVRPGLAHPRPGTVLAAVGPRLSARPHPGLRPPAPALRRPLPGRRTQQHPWVRRRLRSGRGD